MRGFFIPGDWRFVAPFLIMLEKKSTWLSALAGVLIAIIVAKGDRITAAVGSLTATMGALGLSQWSMIIGIFCTVATFFITNIVNFIFKKKELALKKEEMLNNGGAAALSAERAGNE